jgi:DNA primase|tara:strand:+ start:1484 stop:2506 length:1023 start_codon:yes stop_codon:yes gene_type:complete
MIVLEFVRQSIPGGWKQSPSGWISGNCPMCRARGHTSDTRKRGGIMFQDDRVQYNCFNCNYKTGWSPGKRINKALNDLLVEFGADPAQIQRVNFELLKENENPVAEFLTATEKKDAAKITWQPADLPTDAVTFNEVDTDKLTTSQLEAFMRAVQYVDDRGMSFYSGWMWTPYSHFKNRVILPFNYKNQVVGYTARWTGTPPDKTTPKYYHQMPKHFVYNLDAQHDHKYVIVTEGQMDALLVNGIATSGNTPSNVQCDIIDDYSTNKQIVVVPDADSAGLELINTAVNRGWAVSFPPWEKCKDAADAVEKYGRLFTVKSILDSVETNRTKIQLLARSYCRD